MNLSKNLRAIRKKMGLTLSDVAERSGIPASTLSKVENGKLSLSYAKLLDLSSGLDIDIAALFSDSAGDAPSLDKLPRLTTRRSVNRCGEGDEEETDTYRHLFLSTDLLKKRFDPIIADLKVKSIEDFGELVRHDGEEFAYVLEGELIFYTEFYAPLALAKGDSIYFDSSMGHAYIAASEGPCRILSICTHGGRP